MTRPTECIVCGAPALRSELNGAHAAWCDEVAERNRQASDHSRTMRRVLAGDCVTCGTDREQSTPGCHTCMKRHANRSRRARQAS